MLVKMSHRATADPTWKCEYQEAYFIEGHLWRLASTTFTGQSKHTVDCSIAEEQGERI